MVESIWSKTESLPEREPLPGNITVDAAVIGAGIAGILTACFLREQGVETVVLEAKRIGSGQTKNTTAKITSQHGLIYDRLIRQFGEKRAREYAEESQRSIEEYERLIREYQINCSFERLPSYLYTQRFPQRLAKECSAACRLGIPAEFVKETELPFPVSVALRFDRQAQFHPLRFLKAVSGRLTVFENTAARKVEGNKILTDRGEVTAKHIVFATHFPFMNYPGFYFTRLHQERSYVLALEGVPALSGMYFGTDKDGLSFRTAEGKLLLGGGGHRTGKTTPSSGYKPLFEKARQLWPQAEVYKAYSAQDCMTLDGVPYIGRFSPTRPFWYVATGFQKWGMTGAMTAARKLSRQIMEEKSRESCVFSPRRFVPAAAVPTLLREVGTSGKGLLKEILYLPGKEFDRLPKGQGAVIRYFGKKRGAYKDERGNVYLVSVRCPHLGCQLEWNEIEKTWDCPCHGSRFDYKGQLIDNPAQNGLRRF